MVKFRGHYRLNSVVLIPTAILIALILRFDIWHLLLLIPMTAVSIVFGAKGPDLDLTSKKLSHRNIYFHTTMFFSGFTLLAWIEPYVMLFLAMINFGIGLHLLGDIKLKGRQGFYCIVYSRYYDLLEMEWVEKRMSGRQTTWWLFSNWLVSVAVLVLVAGWLSL